MNDATIMPFKLKDGTEIPVGSHLFWGRGKAYVWYEGRHVRISPLTAARLLGIARPTLEQLQFWVYDSVCESILGEQVEPDGVDQYGSPSWLLAEGLV